MKVSIKIKVGDTFVKYWMDFYEWQIETSYLQVMMGEISMEKHLNNLQLINKQKEMENQKAQLNSLRVNLDGLAQLVKLEVNDNYMLTVCEQCLLMAKAWTGKLLGELGGTSPYSAGKSTIEHIEPTDAKAKLDGSTEGVAIDIEVWVQYNEIQKLDVLRQTLTRLCEQVKLFNTIEPVQMNREANICRTHVWSYLNEASIYAGFRLGEIRDGQ